MRVFLKRCAALFCFVVLASLSVEAQTARPRVKREIVAISGTIYSTKGQVIPGAQVNFVGDMRAITYADDRGHYKTTLIPGYYKMIVLDTEWRHEFSVERPRFYIGSRKTLSLDAFLELARWSCDLGSSNGEPIDPAIYPDVCGGADEFEIPASDGHAASVIPITGPTYVPAIIPSSDVRLFSAVISYGERKRNGAVYSYTVGRVSPRPRVSLLYNLFSIQADNVTYDLRTFTVRASGSVEISDGTGVPKKADAATFQLRDGGVITVAN